MSFDLAAYLARIRLGARPTLDHYGLAAMQRAHRLAIPFENLDIRLGRGVAIDSDAVFAKLVTAKRGGYCFEQNRLFADALDALGFTAASGYSFLPRLLLQRASGAPNIDVALNEMVSAEQIEALTTGRIDVGLLRPPITRSEFTTLKVTSEPLVAALPFGDARLAKARLTLKDFDATPLVMYAPDGAGYFHDMLAGLFEAAGVAPIVVQSLSQIHSMLALVRSGLGAALVPEAAMSLHFDDVHFRPVTTVPAAPVELYAAWRSDNDNPALAAFLDLLRSDDAGAIT